MLGASAVSSTDILSSYIYAHSRLQKAFSKGAQSASLVVHCIGGLFWGRRYICGSLRWTVGLGMPGCCCGMLVSLLE